MRTVRPALIAGATMGVALMLRLGLQGILGSQYAFIHFYPAVFISAWLGGGWAGVLCTVASAASARYFFQEPLYSFTLTSTADRVAQLVFLLSGFLVSALAAQRRNAVHLLNRGKAERDRLAAQQLELANRATRYREWLTTLIADVPAVVWEAWGQPDEQSQRINFVNHYVESMLGYSESEWLLKPNFWLTIVHPEDRDRAAREAAAIFNSGTHGTSRFRWIRKDGEVLWVESTSTVITDVTGTPVGLRGVTVDVSESIRIQAERSDLLLRTEHAREEAEAANRLKDEFLMTLSHELRTPLNAIWGWTRILRTHPSDSHRVDHGLEVIERNARVQLQLIEDLLDISRIVVGKLRLNVQHVKLASVAAVIIETMRPAADAKGVALELIVDDSARHGGVSGDPDRLQQVLWNLVSNAVKFTPRDGRIAIRVDHGSSFAQVVVSDTGEGIDAILLPVIFDRFRQGHSGASRPHAGLGLGLAIARNLIEAHGGTLSASSPGQGRGATFTAMLPLAAADSPIFEDLALAATPVRGDRLEGVRVLAVDADAEHRELLDTVLRDEGAVVEVVSNAAAAFEILAPFAPDVMISNIELPSEDGHSLIRRIRANESGKRALAAIALTASPRAEDRINALDAGFHAYLAKPVEPAELTALILSLLDVRPRDAART